MQIRKLWLFLALLAAVPLAGCERCEDRGERTFGLVFYQNNFPVKRVFPRVYGLGGNGDISFNSADSLYRLPVSMHQDSSTFIFVDDQENQHTLTVRYKRDFIYQSKTCGFRVKFSNFSVGSSTTFQQATIITTQYQPGYIFTFPEDVYQIWITL